MEIEIDSKRNNPLLNRTEVYFTIKHEGESTPNREFIRSELADKLNVKKENIIVNTVDSSFGKQEISGYAKIYSSIATAKDIETEHILQRNKVIEGGKKPAKKGEAPPPAKKEEAEVKPTKPEGEAKPEEIAPEAGEAPKKETPVPPKPVEKKIEPAEKKEEHIPKDSKPKEKAKEEHVEKEKSEDVKKE